VPRRHGLVRGRVNLPWPPRGRHVPTVGLTNRRRLRKAGTARYRIRTSPCKPYAALARVDFEHPFLPSIGPQRTDNNEAYSDAPIRRRCASGQQYAPDRESVTRPLQTHSGELRKIWAVDGPQAKRGQTRLSLVDAIYAHDGASCRGTFELRRPSRCKG
jgi:hypothetical protein